jgi:hypothetical protein
MDATLKTKANDILSLGLIEIIQSYTMVALLTNACALAAERYVANPNVLLLTTDKIPPPFRLDLELDVTYHSSELVEKYQNDVLDVVLKNYYVVSISIIDAVLEDLYELFIQSIEPELSELEVRKKIRNAWANDQLLDYFISRVGLAISSEGNATYRELFTRYKELRVIRHALVHSKGKISPRDLNLLREFEQLTPEPRKQFAIINSPLIENGDTVAFTVERILTIRKFLFTFINFQINAIENIV